MGTYGIQCHEDMFAIISLPFEIMSISLFLSKHISFNGFPSGHPEAEDPIVIFSSDRGVFSKIE